MHGAGTQTFCQLLKEFGSTSYVYAAGGKQLKKVVSDKIASEIIKGVDEDSLVDSLNWLSQTNNHFVTLADPDYPKALLEIADPPPVLYAKGNLALLN